jgi:hypothetical protein
LRFCVANAIFSPFKVAKAKEAEEKIDFELKTLQQTLADIEEARPFDQLTVRLLSCVLCFCSDAFSLRPMMSQKHTPVLLRLSRLWSERESGLCQVCSSFFSRLCCV